MYIAVLGIGLLRILQAMCNKQTSGHMNARERYLIFGCYFEAAAALFSLFGKKTKPSPQPMLSRPMWAYGPLLGAVCASIVFLTTRFSRVVPLVVMHTVPSAVSIICF